MKEPQIALRSRGRGCNLRNTVEVDLPRVPGPARDVDEAHSPVRELAAFGSLTKPDFYLMVARVAFDDAKDVFNPGLRTFEHLEKRAGMVQEHPRYLFVGIGNASADQKKSKVVRGERNKCGTGVDKLEHLRISPNMFIDRCATRE
jgi:hypothetical protein